MRAENFAWLVAPFVLVACAAAPPARAPAAPPPPASTPAAAPVFEAAPAPAPAEDAEAQLLARIDQLGGELDFRQETPGPRRLAIAPTPFKLDELPVAHIEPPFEDGHSPLIPKSALASELMLHQVDFDGFQRTLTVSFKEATLGQVIVGGYQIRNTTLNRTTSNPSHVNCSRNYSPSYQPARWTSLRRGEDGRVQYTVTDGWLNSATCKISVERRTTVAAVPLVPGELLYGFRDCKGAEGDKAACGEDALLTLIFPNAQVVVGGGLGGEVRGHNSAFGVASIPLRRGGGASLFVRLDDQGLVSFRAGLGGAPPRPWSDPAFAGNHGFGLGVEVVQGVGDPAPIAIAYLARDSAIERVEPRR